MLQSYPKKPCKYCGSRGHWPYQCFKNPKDRKYLRKQGKYAKEWEITKRTWYDRNPPNPDPYPHYVCYLPGHGEWLRPPGKLAGFDNPLTIPTTLDHVLSKGRHPELRAAQWDLRPCCPDGNQEKGSKDGVLTLK
jgi:5-methylcytosine-specific restriction endonuclease McrA